MNLNSNVTNVSITTPSIKGTDFQQSVREIKSDGNKIAGDKNGIYLKPKGLGQNIDIRV